MLYGIGRDLSQKMIIPALPVIGVDRGDLDIVALRKHLHDSVHVPFRRSACPPPAGRCVHPVASSLARLDVGGDGVAVHPALRAGVTEHPVQAPRPRVGAVAGRPQQLVQLGAVGSWGGATMWKRTKSSAWRRTTPSVETLANMR
ncbi:MAG: hypothetical protein QOE54_4843 [Streptosporangiaceae bacterium]|nr:hypothetical protein [Streptosporangiaceae bacterium]